MSRIEKKLIDKVLNGYLLKKRQIGRPFKYNIEPSFDIGR
jgi:hypothetical protein